MTSSDVGPSPIELGTPPIGMRMGAYIYNDWPKVGWQRSVESAIFGRHGSEASWRLVCL